MPIDVHAHYVPAKILDVLEHEGDRYGVRVASHEPTCQKCLRFEYGLQIRPFFAKLVEPVDERIESMRSSGIDREILSEWQDNLGYALTGGNSDAWQQLLEHSLGESVLCGV